jgi:pimeloyl-ACP methyl ester carboxylesterase
MLARRSMSILLALPLYCGCAGVPVKTSGLQPQLPPEGVTGVVFCADGSGGMGGTTEVLQSLVAESCLPLRVEMVEWSHGPGRYLADHLDWRNIERQAEYLVRQTRSWQARYPDKRIYFVGQSAGAAVVLEAASGLPRDSIERVVLLAPSVSARYDLRPALCSASQGIDVFYSTRDWFVLGLGMALSGTTDRRLGAAAGRIGFRPVVEGPADEALYTRRLRQHAWEPSVSWTGHSGGHFGADNPCHLRAYVLPLLTPPPPRSPRQVSPLSAVRRLP